MYSTEAVASLVVGTSQVCFEQLCDNHERLMVFCPIGQKPQDYYIEQFHQSCRRKELFSALVLKNPVILGSLVAAAHSLIQTSGIVGRVVVAVHCVIFTSSSKATGEMDIMRQMKDFMFKTVEDEPL